jgi:CHAD domain-containing protein
MSAFRPRHLLLETRLRRFTRMFPGVERGDVRAVHRTRVASRRLREVVPVLQLDARVAHRLTRKLRKLTRRLGRLRELDVLSLLVDELQDSGRFPARALERIKDEVTAARREYQEELADAGFDAEMRKVSRKLEQALDRLRRDSDDTERTRAVRWAIDARLARRAAALKEAIDEAGNVYLVGRLHTVRIALKKLRYGLEVAQELGGQPDSAELRLLKREQQVLGRLHDLQVLIDRVRRVQGSLAPPDLAVWRGLDQVIRELDTSCRRLHARYIHNRPSLLQLCDRLQSHASGERRARSRKAG